MVKSMIPFFLLVSFLFPANSEAQDNECTRKEQALQHKLEEAQRWGNHAQETRLKHALQEVRQWCTPENLLEEAKEKVAEKQHKVEERETALRQAQQKGKIHKIEKAESKLKAAKEELRQAEEHYTRLLQDQQ